MICMSLKIIFNVILPYRPRSSKWSLSPRFFPQNHLHLVYLIYGLCAHPSHSSRFVNKMTFGEE